MQRLIPLHLSWADLDWSHQLWIGELKRRPTKRKRFDQTAGTTHQPAGAGAATNQVARRRCRQQNPGRSAAIPHPADRHRGRPIADVLGRWSDEQSDLLSRRERCLGLRLSRREQLLQGRQPGGLHTPHLPAREGESNAFLRVGRFIHKHRNLPLNPRFTTIGAIRSTEHRLG